MIALVPIGAFVLLFTAWWIWDIRAEDARHREALAAIDEAMRIANGGARGPEDDPGFMGSL